MTGPWPLGVEAALTAVVEVCDDSGFLGSGFVLSPGTVLTAAHVARRGRSGLGVRGPWGWVGATSPVRLFPAEPGDGRFHAFPDLALLDLDREVEQAPFALDAGRPPNPGTVVLVAGFSTYTPMPGAQEDSLLLTVAGPSAGYLRVTGDEVKDGFSGSMVIRLDSGAVCGVLKGSRDFDGVRGGWFTPLAALAAALPAGDPLQKALTPGAGTAAMARPAEEAQPTQTTRHADLARDATPAGPAAPAPRAAAARPATSTRRATTLPGARELVPLLLAIPDMDDPDFRRQVLRGAAERLGPAAPLRVAYRAQAVDHLIETVQACASHRDPAAALTAVLDTLDFLRPGLAAVDELRALAGLPEADPDAFDGPDGADDPGGPGGPVGRPW
ncbi:trypsin-like peptidase domain-containing protein [Kitasatospora sp. NPDC058170]|uniref:trypsin-like peptidase domain-containing protein n=1 Tax=Kitasatospora sp. NPDC058170 TaxID=3346364 RepID=UPI0036DB0412